MAAIFIEQRKLGKNVALTWDMAHHLYTQYKNGLIIVVALNPAATHAALRKQWLRIIYKLHKEYSATLESNRKHTIESMINDMTSLIFTVDIGSQLDSRGVFIISPDSLLIAPRAHTIYCTYEDKSLGNETLSIKLASRGLLVRYY